jgi:diguanylate cyclase (GGDEF)-like protein
MSLLARILLLVLLATLMPAVVFGVYEFNHRASEVDEAERNLNSQVKYATATLQDKVRASVQLLHGLSRAPDLERSKGECSNFLADVLERHPQYTDLVTFTSSGDLYCDALRTGRRLNVGARRYFKELLISRQPAFEVVVGGLTGISVFQAAYPVIGADGTLKFVLLASLNLAQFAQDVAAGSAYPNSRLVIWNRDGVLMASKPDMPGESLVGKSLSESELFHFAASAAPGAIARVKDLDGADRLWALGVFGGPADGGGARIVLGVPRGVLLAEADRGLRTALVLLIGVSIVAFVSAWFLARLSIGRPAERMIGVASRLAAGDLSARIGAPYPSGELGQLMATIDRTADAVQTQQSEIESSSRDLRRANRTLQMLSGINMLIVRVRDREELYKDACRIAVEKGGFRMSMICILDRITMKIVPVASAGKDEMLLSTIKAILSSKEGAPTTMVATAIAQKVALVSNDSGSDQRVLFVQKYIESSVRSMAVIPLMVAGEAIGVFALYSNEVGFFHQEEMRLLKELAGDIAHAIDHIEKQEQLDYLAYYDETTGLANRTLFHNRLSQNLRARGGEQPLIATVLVDLARFRRVNDTLGRSPGDELLRSVGLRLLASNDSAARMGADMFAFVLRGARTAAEVNRAVDAIVAECFAEPFSVGSERLRIVCHVGVALFPGDGVDADGLLRNAEAALRRSKRSSDRIVFYAPEMNARVAEALSIETNLRRAIDQREFVLLYQPKINLASGHITGLEALIRWQDPEKGLIPPANFIPVLEETGMIVEAGRWVVEQAFVDLRAWAAQGVSVPRVAVNVSAIQLQGKDFVDGMIDEIRRGGDFPEWLELEITESVVMGNVEDNIRKLSILRGMGVTVAIDDFGTGYSSLNYLSKLPLDSLKIDRSFVSRMTNSAEAVSIVSTIIALAHGLKLKVIAEGVETVEQSQSLALLGCDEAQGYLFAKPLPGESIEVLLRSGGRPPVIL